MLPLKEWMVSTVPLDKSPYMKEWMAQGDPLKEACTFGRINGRPFILDKRTALQNGRYILTHCFTEWTTASSL